MRFLMTCAMAAIALFGTAQAQDAFALEDYNACAARVQAEMPDIGVDELRRICTLEAVAKENERRANQPQPEPAPPATPEAAYSACIAEETARDAKGRAAGLITADKEQTAQQIREYCTDLTGFTPDYGSVDVTNRGDGRVDTDPEACRAYAAEAVEAGERNLVLGCKLEGPRWGTNASVHEGWCQTAEPAWITNEKQARYDALAICQACHVYAQSALKQFSRAMAKEQCRSLFSDEGVWLPSLEEVHFAFCYQKTSVRMEAGYRINPETQDHDRQRERDLRMCGG